MSRGYNSLMQKGRNIWNMLAFATVVLAITAGQAFASVSGAVTWLQPPQSGGNNCTSFEIASGSQLYYIWEGDAQYVFNNALIMGAYLNSNSITFTTQTAPTGVPTACTANSALYTPGIQVGTFH
jgi:hypothetical protein